MEAKYSVSPSGEKFAIPEKAEYAKEFERIAKLVEQNRAAGKEIVAVLAWASSARSWRRSSPIPRTLPENPASS